MRPEFLRCGAFRFSLERPLIMGVINVTPDSFSDGGELVDPQLAIARAKTQLEQGADILDIGGESTRPGAAPVSLEMERRRVLPVLEALLPLGVPISIDTRKPAFMREVLNLGASMINDVSGFGEPSALEAVAETECCLCIMHMLGEPNNMQNHPQYDNVVETVTQFLAGRVAQALAAGISRERLVIDPGFGFGKTLDHNLSLLGHLSQIADLQCAVLAGLSRKSMLGTLTGHAPRDRVHASVAAALIAVQNGAHIVRVHDVGPTRDALTLWAALQPHIQVRRSEE
jgi:dihydropteroate synthase